MDVQMPDGTIITGVPDNITQSELLTRYQAFQPPAGGLPTLTSTLPPTSNPLYGLVSRAGSIVGEGIEGIARLAEKAGDKLETIAPISGLTAEQITQERQLEPLFRFAESTKAWARGINYEPSTKLSELTSNPLNAIPFIAERVISSTPDMAAAVLAAPAYVTARTNEILNERLKNDNKTLEDATVKDVTMALGGAVLETTLERGATKALGRGKSLSGASAKSRLAKMTAYQSGTEAAEEGISYLAGTVDTKKGVDRQELFENMIEGAIVGGGLGGGVQGTKEYLDYRNKKKEVIEAPVKEEAEKVTEIEQAIPAAPEQIVVPESESMDTAAQIAEFEGRPEIAERPEIPTWDTLSKGQQITLYRGENAQNEPGGMWWTTNRAKAEKYGDVSEVTLDSELVARHAARGANGADEFVFGNVRPADLAIKSAPAPTGAVEPVDQVQPPQRTEPSEEDIVRLNEKGEPIEAEAVTAEKAPAQADLPENTILQNRERSSPTSIAQMNAIANKPDYSRVAFSNSFLEGAPVVFGAQPLPAEQTGRKGSIVSAKTNRKIPVQYGVVDADQLLASNAVDGSSVPEYANPSFAGFKAVTNGRVAGLKEGYRRGTMEQYKQDLINDDIHGVSPEVISKMKNPILVRVMPQNQVTPDIADESNTSSTLALSATERAKNDANRINLDGLAFRDDGAISADTVRGFVAAMPQSEQQELIDKQGRPTRQAYDRLNAAIFYKAYGNDALVSLAAEAKSVDAANIINGLSQAAPQMAQLAEAGDYDIRPQVVQAAETAINASRQGKKLSDVIEQQDLVSDNPISRQILQLFANNTRSAKRIGEGLRGVAADVQTEASRPQEPDMFGEIQERVPVAQVVESSLAKPSEADVISEAKGVALNKEEGLTQPTVQDLKAKQTAIDKAAADKARAEREADAREKKERERKEVEDRQAKAADGFRLGKSAEDDLSGQGALFSKGKAESIFEARRESANQERNNWFSNKFQGAPVVYESGDLALVRANNKYNDPVYIPVNGDKYIAADISLKTKRPSFLTSPEFKELVAAKERLEKADAEKHIKDPFIKFKDGIAVSQSISPELANVFAGWKKMLRINRNVYLSTNQDAVDNAEKFTGSHRRVGYAGQKSIRTERVGVMQRMGDDILIVISDAGSQEKILEILSHELGHAHMSEVFYDAPKEMQEKVNQEYKAWLKQQKGVNAQKLINSLRPFNMAKDVQISMPNARADLLENYDEYWTSFSEWYADNVARWATTSAKPLSVVDKFFAKVAQTLRSFYDAIKAGGFLPNETFKEYMDAITDKEAVAANPIIPDDAKGQLPLFAKQAAQMTLPGIKPKPAKGKTQIPTPLPGATWTNLPDMTKKDEVIIALVDKNYNLSKAQQAIEQQVGKIQDEINAYRKETLSHGRAEAREKDFYVEELLPIIKEMKAKKVSDEAMTEYLVMRHAEEANDLIAKRNPNNPARQDNGIGVTYKEREDYFKNLNPERKKVFESLASKVDAILKKTRDVLENGGVISAEERKAWEDLFEFYVPTRREESDFLMPSSGYRRVGDFAKSRVGSSRKVVDVLSNIAINRLIAINRVEKERIGRAMYGMTLMHPNPEYFMAVSPDAIKNKDKLINEIQDQFGMTQTEAEKMVNYVMTEPTRRYYNKETGEVNTVTDVQAKYRDYVLPVKIQGKDRFVFANPKNPRAVQMIQSLRGLDVDQLRGLWAMSAPITRWFAAVNTQYNLIFGAFNFVRDVMGSQLKLTATDIADKKLEVLNGTFKAMPEIYTALRERNEGKKFSDTSDGSWADYVSHGGKVGYKDQFQNLKDSTNLVEKELAKLDRGNARKAAEATLNWISNVNDVFENSARLSAYRSALNKYKADHKGKITERDLENMKDRAADIAKNLTVNFNRKGTWGAKAGSLFAFFNASVQGTKNLADTLRGPKGKMIMSAGVTIGIAQALLLAEAGFDEDEPAEFIKQKNLIFPTGDGGYVMVPMPFGFNVFPNIGRLMVEGLIKTSKGKDASEKLYDTITMFANAFNPLGGGGFWQMVTPTALDPLAALAENRDAFGRPISRESRGTSPKPGYTLSRDPSPSISQFLSEFINNISFGNKDKRGWVSPTADQIDYLAGQVTGGVGREIMRAGKFAANVAEGKETPESQVPIKGKIIGSITSPQAISQRFYNNVKAMSEHKDAIKGRIDRRENVSEYMRDYPEASLWRRADTLENEISKLNTRRRELVKKEAPYEQIKRIDDQKTRMMKQFNDSVRQRERQ